MNSNSSNKKKSGNMGVAIGVALGISFGAAFGAAFDNVGVGVALGICFGAALGPVLFSWQQAQKENKPENENGA